MDSFENLSNNPWAKYLGITSIEYYEVPEKTHKPKSTVTRLNPEDMKLFGHCPVYEDFQLTICKICESILKPQALKAHMERRHAAKVKKKEEEQPELLLPSTSSTKLVSSPPVSPSLPTSSSSPHQPPFLPPSSAQASPDSSTWALRVAPPVPCKEEPPTELSSSSSEDVVSFQPFAMEEAYRPNLPDDGGHCSNSSPSSSSSSSSESSSSGSATENSDCSPPPAKAPALEKLVLRRVLQTGPNTSDARSSALQKGVKGVSRSKKDSQETYFMVVKQKDRQQNLLAANHQLRKQSNVVHKEKNKVDQKLNQLESVRNKLISQLFQELKAVKKKLHQCSVSKAELNKELMTVRSQLEEARRVNQIQTEALSKQNADYKKEIQDLKDKIDFLTASTSSFLEQQQMANQACSVPNDDLLRKHLQYCEEQKFEFQKRLEKLESELKDFKKFSSEEKKRLDLKVQQYSNIISVLKRRLDQQISQNEELRTQKDMLEKHLPPEIRFQVKSQIANFQAQQEIYPGLNLSDSTIPSPAVPFGDKYLTDLRNIEYCAFQHQMAND